MKFLLSAIIFCASLSSSFAAVRGLSESELLTWAKGNVPQLEEIKATMLASETQRNLLEEKYAPEAFAKGTYAETRERPIIEFFPVFSPLKTAQIGVRKKFSNGFETQLAASTDQRSAYSSLSGRYHNVTTSILSFMVQMDLWKDAFGRVSEAERRNADLERQRAELESDIRARVFAISLRRLYWSLVATEEQLKISESLKQTAGEQLKDARRRLASSIGDAGEVARYEAQLANRTGQSIFLTYQKENLLKQIKQMLPEFGTADFVLSPYNIDQTIAEVVDCSMVIQREQSIPYQYTRYDEVMNLLREVRSNQKAINSRYGDIDVKLFGTVKSTGVGSNRIGDSNYRGSYGASVDDMKNNNRTGYEAGINLTVPLGDAKDLTQKTKALYDEKRLKAQIDQSDSQVVSTHTQLAKSMKLIQDVIATQKISTTALQKRLKVVRQKYSQARISVNDLILDQDAYLNSEFTTIDAQLQAVNIVLDYLMVFTETPCAFNRI